MIAVSERNDKSWALAGGANLAGSADAAAFGDLLQVVEDTQKPSGGTVAYYEANGGATPDADDSSVYYDPALSDTDTDIDALLEQLSKWADMTPAEKIRAQYLEENDLTESALAAMPPEERMAIEKQIAEAIERQLGLSSNPGKNGDAADTTVTAA